MKARIRLQKDCIISPIDPRVFGSFIEHLGRAVYTGIYEPGHPTADAFGFRGDVEELIRPLHVTQIRYPGGNFLSGYDWRDGIGPKDKRPVRPDMAWSAIEPNQVGTDEFLQWCERIGAQPMMAVNLGTGTPKDAVELLEYCNGDMHTYWADKRRENGREAPYNVKLWCLGNEMDGPWQICSKTATEYGRIACETAKLMKMFDPTIETVACGSSYRTMPTFGTWEEEVLRQSYPYVDYLSLHQYYTNHEGDVMNFLARSEEMGEFIQEVAAICEKIRLEVGSDKHIGLSFDEWNVWYHYAKNGKVPEKWTVARPIEEENYDFADALLVGSMLNTLLNTTFTGLTLEEITPELMRVAQHAAGEAYGLISLVVSFAMEVLESLEQRTVHTSGLAHLLELPEYRSLERAQPLMSYLSEDADPARFPVPKDDPMKILIGPENVADELKDTSVVMASYDIGDNMRGVIGVVGPTRMDYAKVPARLSYFADSLTRMFGKGELPSGEGDGDGQAQE